MARRLARLLTAIAIVCASDSSACSCGPAGVPLKALAGAAAVFTGEVISIAKDEIELEGGIRYVRSLTAEFKIAESIKGKLSGKVKVQTGGGGGDCGFPFEKGQNYLVYAYKTEDGNFTTDICTRTTLLDYAATEILELQGKLPTPKHPPAPPSLSLFCSIDDAGYEGLIFDLDNHLHERIFLFLGSTNTHLVQVFRNNQWVDYAPNCGTQSRGELTTRESKAEFVRWKESYVASNTAQQSTYVDRLSTTREFIAIPTTKMTWRVGLQYLTEQEFDAGQQIQKSKRYIWSEAIIPTRVDVPKLPFDKAFGEEAMKTLPDPLGAGLRDGEESPSDLPEPGSDRNPTSHHDKSDPLVCPLEPPKAETAPVRDGRFHLHRPDPIR